MPDPPHPDRPTRKEPPAVLQSRRHRLTVRLSYDEARTWPVSRLLYKGSSVYSSLANLAGGRIGLLFDRDNYRKITFAQITLGWLTTGTDQPTGAQ